MLLQCRAFGPRRGQVALLRLPDTGAGLAALVAAILADEASTGSMGDPVPGTPGRPLLTRLPDTHLDTGKASPWRELQRLAGVAVQSMFTPLAFVENEITDAQVRQGSKQ